MQVGIWAVGDEDRFDITPGPQRHLYDNSTVAVVVMKPTVGQRLGTLYLGRMPEPGQAWSHKGSVQDGVYSADQTRWDVVEHRGRTSDCGPARDSAEWGLDRSASVVLAIQGASRNANSAGFGKEKAQKSRIIPGAGAIPLSAGRRRCRAVAVRLLRIPNPRKEPIQLERLVERPLPNPPPTGPLNRPPRPAHRPAAAAIRLGDPRSAVP
jgi:hypothetical protein